MTKKVVEELFKSLFGLTDLRQILRDTKPFYNLNEEQKERVRSILKEIRGGLEIIEEELLK